VIAPAVFVVTLLERRILRRRRVNTAESDPDGLSDLAFVVR
jgi:hypothetical protein